MLKIVLIVEETGFFDVQKNIILLDFQEHCLIYSLLSCVTVKVVDLQITYSLQYFLL